LWGWRGVFFAEARILLLVPYLIFGLKESEIWKAQRAQALRQAARRYAPARSCNCSPDLHRDDDHAGRPRVR
jgi:hypothetical protein